VECSIIKTSDHRNVFCSSRQAEGKLNGKWFVEYTTSKNSMPYYYIIFPSITLDQKKLRLWVEEDCVIKEKFL
jgi:hypothetical protein